MLQDYIWKRGTQVHEKQRFHFPLVPDVVKLAILRLSDEI